MPNLDRQIAIPLDKQTFRGKPRAGWMDPQPERETNQQPDRLPPAKGTVKKTSSSQLGSQPNTIQMYC